MIKISDYFPSLTAKTVYTPAAVDLDGTCYQYDDAHSYSGNAMTFVARVKIPSFTGNTQYRFFSLRSASIISAIGTISSSDYATDTEVQNRFAMNVRNGSNVTICALASDVNICDGEWHTLFFSYDADAGTAVFEVDGQNADNTGWTNRVAPSVDTIYSASLKLGVYNDHQLPSYYTVGQANFIGFHRVYITNSSLFFDDDNQPRKIDETGWTEWGSQPYVWSESGNLVSNKGTVGPFAQTGEMGTADENITEAGFLPPRTTYSYPVVNGDATNGTTGWTGDVGSGVGVRANSNFPSGQVFWGLAQAAGGAYQDILAIDGEITAELIDSGRVLIVLSHYFGCYNDNDQSRMNVAFFDGTPGSPIATPDRIMEYQTGPQELLAEPAELCEQSFLVPPLTRTFRLYLRMNRVNGTDNNGYISGVGLRAYIWN